MSKEIFEQVYDLVRQVPLGRVTTYGDIASILNINPRYVGYILHNNPYPGDVPCHRVVNSEGRVAITFAFGGDDAQQKLLEAEGVAFVSGKIPMNIFRYRF
jgi:methylated-DNA-protein-cysteine methyltransferase-like protein